MLTPLDLNGKTFSKGFRGFDTDEVKRFMDQVSKDFERLYQDNVELKDTVERVSAKLEYYQRMEGTMQNTLLVAQETADEVKKSSEQKSAVLMKETEIECKKQQEEIAKYCDTMKYDSELEANRIKSDAETYAEKIRKEADEYAARARSQADDYDKLTRSDADSYAAGLREKTGSATDKLRLDAQSFVDKMKSMAEIEVAKMKVTADDNCKLQLADSREKARTLVAEATAHSQQLMADSNQQSQTMIAEATQKANAMVAEAQKKSQDMVAEAIKKSQTMMAEATERSRKMIYEATERSQKMVFVAEAKASAAMDTYKTLVHKANYQSTQLKSLLQSQLSLYDNFDAENVVDEIVQPKLQAIKPSAAAYEAKAEPVEYRTAAENDTVAEQAAATRTMTPAGATAETQAAAGFAAAQPAAAESQEHDEIPPVTWDEPEEMGPGTGMAQPTAMSHAAAETGAEIKDKGEEVPQIRKPFFSHFKPHTVVFNRNGFPRKNADLRVALSQMREEAGAEKETGVEKEAGAEKETEKPDENKES